jgi:ABC-2 type transport system permease protein
MNRLGVAIWAELLKARRSRVLWLTFLAFSFLPLMSGFFMKLLQDPSIAAEAGIMHQKAKLLTGRADWLSFMGLITQGVAVGGLLVFGFLTSWLFGREYADHTLKDLLALPIPRTHIMLAKFGVVSGLCLLLAMGILLEGLAIGYLLNLDPWPATGARALLLPFFQTVGLIVLLCFPVALLANIGQGYLSPLGFVMITLVLAQVMGAAGLGTYFPWSVPGLNTGMAGPVQLPPLSFLLVWLTGLAGVLSTLLWCRYADFDK